MLRNGKLTAEVKLVPNDEMVLELREKQAEQTHLSSARSWVLPRRAAACLRESAIYSTALYILYWIQCCQRCGHRHLQLALFTSNIIPSMDLCRRRVDDRLLNFKQAE